jgi:hypothetical protein
LKLKINGPGGAVIINIGIKIEAALRKHASASILSSKLILLAVRGVIEKSPPIHRPDETPVIKVSCKT